MYIIPPPPMYICVFYHVEYLKYLTNWFRVLLPMMRKHLYSNGGPIISIQVESRNHLILSCQPNQYLSDPEKFLVLPQVENEYGDFAACDHSYLEYLFALFKALIVDDVVYFTLDSTSLSKLKCGSLDGTLTTIDFGSGL